MEIVTGLLLLFATEATSASVSPPNSTVCIACRADVERMRSGYSEADWQALTQGEIVTSQTEEPQADGSVQSHIESSAILSYPAAMVWSVVTDFAARPKFVPGLKDVRIVRVNGNRVWAEQHVRLFLVNIRYQVIDTLEPEQGLASWTLDKSVEHDIADTKGSWQIAPLPPDQMTLVRYRAWVDTGRPVPRFIADFVTKRSLPKVVGGLRSEVRRRFSDDMP